MKSVYLVKSLVNYVNNRCTLCGIRLRRNWHASAAAANLQVDGDLTSKLNKDNVNSDLSDSEYIEGQVFVKGENIPPPFESIDSYEWPDYISNYFKLKNFPKPTPIQAHGWSIATSGRDLVGIAQTGSGKTLAYLLPGLVHVDTRLAEKKANYVGPKALVLLPTRELCQQVHDVCREIDKYPPTSLYGGVRRDTQFTILQSIKPEIVFSTPGRLSDFIDCNAIDISDVTYLVLDEADRMLEMGFEACIRRIIKRTDRLKRQTLMWSATWPKEVNDLALEFLKDFVQINVGSKSTYANPNIKQQIIFCEPHEKETKLMELLKKLVSESDNPEYDRILIFATQKQKVDYLVRLLASYGFMAIGLHGDKVQSTRTSILENFRQGHRKIMVATDVASRGLDVSTIKHVISFDMPQVIEDYIHRIGRTARQGKKGFSHAFFTVADIRVAQSLLEILEKNGVEIPDRLRDLAIRSGRELNRRAMAFSRYSPTPVYDSPKPGAPFSNFRRRYSTLLQLID